MWSRVPHRHDTVLRYAVTLQVRTNLYSLVLLRILPFAFTLFLILLLLKHYAHFSFMP